MSNRPSLIKQLVGAVIGGSLGLLVYTAYEHSSPTVIAWLTIPQKDLASNGEGSRMADNDPNNKENIRFEARARRSLKNLVQPIKLSGEGSSPGIFRCKFGECFFRGQYIGSRPFRGAMEEEAASSVDSDASSSEDSSAGTEADRAQAVREMWNSENIEKAPGPDTDALPDSGFGVLGALVAAGAGAGDYGQGARNNVIPSSRCPHLRSWMVSGES